MVVTHKTKRRVARAGQTRDQLEAVPPVLAIAAPEVEVTVMRIRTPRCEHQHILQTLPLHHTLHSIWTMTLTSMTQTVHRRTAPARVMSYLWSVIPALCAPQEC